MSWPATRQEVPKSRVMESVVTGWWPVVHSGTICFWSRLTVDRSTLDNIGNKTTGYISILFNPILLQIIAEQKTHNNNKKRSIPPLPRLVEPLMPFPPPVALPLCRGHRASTKPQDRPGSDKVGETWRDLRLRRSPPEKKKLSSSQENITIHFSKSEDLWWLEFH